MITRLNSASVRKISAGQVITDLSSVVKELLENALDAGAQTVNIRVHGFGLDRIVVDDDGEGIPMPGVIDATSGALQTDAASPLLKSRATTKRRRDEDEQASGNSTALQPKEGVDAEEPSLGFRGEALHSLAQVSKVTVETMHANQSPYAVRLTYDSASHETQLDIGSARQTIGTTVTVEGLFKQLPVRHREFAKNQRKQLLTATSLVKQYAVSHPRLRLVLSHQESAQSAPTTLVSLTGSNDLQRSVSEAYGGLCLSHMSRVEWHCSFGDIVGFVSHVNGGGRMSADRQVFSLNGRIVDLPRIAASLNDAYSQCLPNAHQRQSVAFFLRIATCDAVSYDVNLTPNKRKVLIDREETLAVEVHAAALREFNAAASEGIEIERQVPHQQQRRSWGGASGVDPSKEPRVPGAATAFTQFIYRRRSDGDTTNSTDETAATQQSVVEFGKLGVLLYDTDSDCDGEAVLDAAAIENPSLFSLDSSNSSNDVSSDGGDDHKLRRDDSGPNARSALPRVSSREPSSTGHSADHGSTSDDDRSEAQRSQRSRHEEKEEGPANTAAVVQLSDQGNQQREAGARVAVPFPSWMQLAGRHLGGGNDHGCGCCGDAKANEEVESTPCAHGFSGFLEQTGKELTAYFHKRSFKDMVVVGQFNHGFIIATLGDDIFVIDQHASDEKYNYERLLRSYSARPQPLVQPVAVPMDAEEVELAVAHASDLLKHGFTVRRGADPTKLLVSSVPVLPYDVVSAADVLELVQQLVRYSTITRQLRAVWHSLATKACRTSIMIGTPLAESTMCAIVARLGDLDHPWTCPHGRPTLRHLGNAKALNMSEVPSLYLKKA